MATTLSILIIVATSLIVVYLLVSIIINIYDAKKEILEAILTLKSAIDLSTTNEIAKEVERLQEAKEKKATDIKKSEYEIVKLNGKKYEKVPTKSEACWGDDWEVCALFEYCLSIPPHSVCDGCILREIKEKEKKS